MPDLRVRLQPRASRSEVTGWREGVLHVKLSAPPVELDGSRTTFSYDPTYQLTNENRSGTNPYNTSYQYDPVGNRQGMNDSGQRTTYTYNAGNQMTLVTPPTGQPTT